jgi:hypothetical protein
MTILLAEPFFELLLHHRYQCAATVHEHRVDRLGREVCPRQYVVETGG